MSKQTKQNLVVTVGGHPRFVSEQSDVVSEKFVWSYEIKIDHQGDEIVQLLNRHWRIVDMTGHIEEVHGVGVIGLQPLLKPGTQFIYTSYCQLMTPQGTMSGYYEMQHLDGKHFLVNIPTFILSAPSEFIRL